MYSRPDVRLIIISITVSSVRLSLVLRCHFQHDSKIMWRTFESVQPANIIGHWHIATLIDVITYADALPADAVVLEPVASSFSI